MARGAPDYQVQSAYVAATQFDPNVVWVSNKRFASVDGTGRAFWLDDFSDTINTWYTYKAGDGVAPVRSQDVVYIQPAAAKFEHGTATGSGSSSMARRWIINADTPTGIELALSGDLNKGYFSVQLTLEAKPYLYNAIMRINWNTGVVEIYDGSDYIEVANCDSGYQWYWVPIKMVMDPVNGVYSRIVIGAERTDLTAYALWTSAVEETHYLRALLQATPDGDTAGQVSYCGYALLTLDEP